MPLEDLLPAGRPALFGLLLVHVLVVNLSLRPYLGLEGLKGQALNPKL